MTNQTPLDPEYSVQPLPRSTQTLNPTNSSQFLPPSLNSTIRPQLLLEKQQDQHVDSASNLHLTLLVDHPSPIPTRKGFDSNDFKTCSNSTHSSSSSSSSSSPSSLSPQTFPISIRQRVYQIIDSVPVTILVFLLMAIDFCFFLTAYLYILQSQHSSLFRRLYYILDWITVTLYTLEVNIRLYAYGPNFYFHGALRSLDYVIATANAIFVVSHSVYPNQWVLVTRCIRTLRISTALSTWRERKLKGRTRQQLESLAELLEKEKSDRSKLTKWRIDPDAIAVGERAGRGGFGTVFSGLFRGTLVAIKQVSYPNHERAPTSIEDEAITLVNLRHPNVVLFMGFVHEPSHLWIVTEYCSRGSLRDLLDDTNLRLTEGRILKLALGAARGLAYLHGQDPPVLHLDLKTSNVLISSGWDAKLGDFGLSRSIDKIEKDWFSGTMQYAAPEILQANLFSTAADIYSFGICLWEMAARDVPFQGLSPMEVLWGVVRTKLRPSLEGIKVAAMKTEEGRISNFPDLVPSSKLESLPLKNLSGHHDTRADYQVRKFAHETPSKRCSVTKDQSFSSNERSTQRTGDMPELQDHERLFERVREENDKTDVFQNDPVTVSVVQGIVLPSTLNSKHRASFPATSNGQEEEESNSALHPRKKISAIREQSCPYKEEHGSHLSGLTNKVTQTIQMFDERPPVIRRKEEEGSNDYGVQSKTESLAGSVSGGHSIRTRKNVPERSSLKVPRQFSKLKSSKKLGFSGSRKEIGLKRDEDDPFVRRLASVSLCAKGGDVGGGTSGSLHGHNEDPSAPILNSNGKCEAVGSASVAKAVLPKEYVELMQKCWSHNPKDRPSAGEIVWRLVILIDSQMREK